MNAARPRSGHALGIPRFQATLWLLLLGSLVAGEPPPKPEHQIKAFYLYNFTRYVDWPAAQEGRGGAGDNLFIIGLLAPPEIVKDLETITRAKRVGTRSIVIRRLTSKEEALGCQMVFLTAINSPLMTEVLQAVRTSPVLTVGEGEQFLAKGGIISFVRRENNVRIQLSPDAAQVAGLPISAKLMGVAEVIRNPGPARRK